MQTLRHNVTASHETSELDLGELVRSHYKWLGAALANKEKLQLLYSPASQPAVINASPAMLTQILLNLVKNAAEALGESGTITLAVKRNVHFMDRLYVLLEVSDDGPGLEAWQMQKLFQSGSTTKTGMHTGSGLAIVKKLVDELQGQISCHSENGDNTGARHGSKSNHKTGTTFTILLPQVR
ncbi:MAG: ATP-binding protein [Pseudomonadota bacterium]